MRISDWSSDVCSSDLGQQVFMDLVAPLLAVQAEKQQAEHRHRKQQADRGATAIEHQRAQGDAGDEGRYQQHQRFDATKQQNGVRAGRAVGVRMRSEEHTSELQSLMRLTTDVFCMKKKKQHKQN